jgi:uncharacterized protein DUF2829
MTYEEAFQDMLTGEYVARTAWDQDGKFCVIMPGMEFMWQITSNPVNAGVWMATIKDHLAEDWKVISRTELPKAAFESIEVVTEDSAVA